MKTKIGLVLAVVIFIFPLITAALTCPGGTSNQNGICVPIPSGAGPAGDTTVSQVIFDVIDIALAVVALISVLFLIIGGYRYVTAGGNEESQESAKKTMTNAIVGLAIVILSFVIVNVIANALISSRV